MSLSDLVRAQIVGIYKITKVIIIDQYQNFLYGTFLII